MATHRPINYDELAEKIEKAFDGVVFPLGPFRVDQCTVVTDCKKYLEHNLSLVRSKTDPRILKPYLDDLKIFLNAVR